MPIFNKQTTDKVSWARHTWNPIVGCRGGCPYCYAREIAERAGIVFDEPELIESRLTAPIDTPYPRADDIREHSVFVCSMADLFGPWIPDGWINAVIDATRKETRWNYLFLTKYPQRLCRYTWDDNHWIGATVDCQARVEITEQAFMNVKVSVKYISCEPMVEPLTFSRLDVFDWIIIGGRSETKGMRALYPQAEWVESLTKQAHDAGCLVYYKPNVGTLQPWLAEYPEPSGKSENVSQLTLF